ncbi:hypothetical protein AYI70_g10621 [Smittium culicis]|uniref:Uncharacterized protein n=1 Tax=Smittium culicis TaxID=133412 RepID=A0A1R1X5P7_9FUNG|nr:hypothetical protein AYI70_g10621 [Smittium culicis]
MDTFAKIPLFKSANKDVRFKKSLVENLQAVSVGPMSNEKIVPKFSSKNQNSNTGFLRSHSFAVASIDTSNVHGTSADSVESGKSNAATTGNSKPRNISLLSKSEFSKVLAEAKSKSQEWRSKFEQDGDSLVAQPQIDMTLSDSHKSFKRNEYLEFMNLVSRSSPSGKGASHSSKQATVAPTYHNFNMSTDILGMQVKGRILSRKPDGYYVGVQGLIAFLPANKRSNNSEPITRKLETFYISSIDFNSDGTPNIVLSSYHELNSYRYNNNAAANRYNQNSKFRGGYNYSQRNNNNEGSGNNFRRSLYPSQKYDAAEKERRTDCFE